MEEPVSSAFLERWHPDAPSSPLHPSNVPEWVRTPTEYEVHGRMPVPVAFAGKVRGFLGASGLRMMCPLCYRFQEKGECRIHGRIKCELVVKAKALVQLSRISSADCLHEPPLGPTVKAWMLQGLAPVLLWGDVIPQLTTHLPEGGESLGVARLTEVAREALAYEVTEAPVERALIGQTIAGNGWLVPVDEDGWALLLTRAS